MTVIRGSGTVAALALVAVVFAGCGTGSTGGSTGSVVPSSFDTLASGSVTRTPNPTEVLRSPRTSATGAGVPAGLYLATDITGHQLVPGTSLTLRFDKETLWVEAGCNAIFGPATMGAAMLHLPEPSRTAVGCPTLRQQQDDWIAAFLAAGPRYTVSGTMLVLEGGDVTIILARQDEVGPSSTSVQTTQPQSSTGGRTARPPSSPDFRTAQLQPMPESLSRNSIPETPQGG